MTTEVNVTDFGVVPDSPLDQSDAIITALNNLGTAGFGRTAYFPGATYYISKQLRALDRDTCNITLRGDDSENLS